MRQLLGVGVPASLIRHLTGQSFPGESEFALVPRGIVDEVRVFFLETTEARPVNEVCLFLAGLRNRHQLEAVDLEGLEHTTLVLTSQ